MAPASRRPYGVRWWSGSSCRATPIEARADLLAVGVAPADRRAGLATRMLREHVEGMRPGDVEVVAEVTMAERDAVEPLDVRERASIARRLLTGAGFEVDAADAGITAIDPGAIVGRRR